MIEYGILADKDLGKCPSCGCTEILPRFMNLDSTLLCSSCGAKSYGYKWLADKGKSAKARIDKLYKAMEDLENEFRNQQQ